jgi:hypothetical protein
VGGGYEDTGLSDITLQWMVDSVYEHGLPFKAGALKKLKKNANGILHDSCQGIWVPLGKQVRSIGKTALVHESVQERMKQGYAPKNLPENPTFVER